MSKSPTRYTFVPSPFGQLLIAGNEVGLTHINFQEGAQPLTPEEDWIEDGSQIQDTVQQLHEYFYEDRIEFDLHVYTQGTHFQSTVWLALMTIPCGETASYSEIAHQLGQPTGTRAVASANAKNPIAVVIPCHRVIGSDGNLRGYAGGLDIKAGLLALEQKKCPQSGGQMFID